MGGLFDSMGINMTEKCYLPTFAFSLRSSECFVKKYFEKEKILLYKLTLDNAIQSFHDP